MNLAATTKKQLYQIATDDSALLEHRYEAARRLAGEKEVERMIERCKYPGCGKRGDKTWALVPLCGDHFETIRAESKKYFAGSQHMKYEDREHYRKIAKLIPWSQEVMGEFQYEGRFGEIKCRYCDIAIASNWIRRHEAKCKEVKTLCDSLD